MGGVCACKTRSAMGQFAVAVLEKETRSLCFKDDEELLLRKEC